MMVRANAKSERRSSYKRRDKKNPKRSRLKSKKRRWKRRSKETTLILPKNNSAPTKTRRNPNNRANTKNSTT
jgi:hypothetical protein